MSGSKKDTSMINEDVFKFISKADESTDKSLYLFNLQKLSKIIHNSDFDINVKNNKGKTILHEMSINKYSHCHYLVDIDYLLSISSIEIDEETIQVLISRKDSNPRDAKVLDLYMKYEKIPNILKS